MTGKNYNKENDGWTNSLSIYISANDELSLTGFRDNMLDETF